jgi:hypothetical protein
LFTFFSSAIVPAGFAATPIAMGKSRAKLAENSSFFIGRTVMITQLRRRVGSFLGVLLGLTLLSCGGQTGSGGSGTLQVNLTDLPSNAYSSVVITVTHIGATSESELFDVFTLENPVSVDVLDYQDYSLRLGQGTVPATAYNQLRLVLEENPATGDPVNYVTLNCAELPDEINCDPEQKWPLKTPSGHTSGLKIVLANDLLVTDGGVALLTIDFAPDTAIVERGDWDPARHDDKERFLIKPTGIHVIQEGIDTIYGELFGSVIFADEPVSGPTSVVTVIDTTTLAAVAATIVHPGEEPGDFRFFLDAGNYDLTVEADGYQSMSDGPFAVTESDVDPRPETDAGAFILEPLVVTP